MHGYWVRRVACVAGAGLWALCAGAAPAAVLWKSLDSSVAESLQLNSSDPTRSIRAISGQVFLTDAATSGGNPARAGVFIYPGLVTDVLSAAGPLSPGQSVQINSATLYIVDSSTDNEIEPLVPVPTSIGVYQMVRGWTLVQNSTTSGDNWNTFGGNGIQADGVEAKDVGDGPPIASAPNDPSFTGNWTTYGRITNANLPEGHPSKSLTNPSSGLPADRWHPVDVTSSVSNWVELGEVNNGWGFVATNNRTQIFLQGLTTSAFRNPAIVIDYSVIPEPTSLGLVCAVGSLLLRRRRG
jgi:hypothetical protein